MRNNVHDTRNLFGQSGSVPKRLSSPDDVVPFLSANVQSVRWSTLSPFVSSEVRLTLPFRGDVVLGFEPRDPV